MKTISFLVAVVLTTNLIKAQSVCPVPVITTDPISAVNTQRPLLANRFDWKQRFIPVRPAVFDGTSTTIESPFYQGNQEYLSKIGFGANSDFKPTDGWELVKRDFGYLIDELSPTTSNTQVLYFILYNKYSGKLRVLAALPRATKLGGILTVRIKFATPGNSSTYKSSGLFAAYDIPDQGSTVTSVLKPLDQTVNVQEVLSQAAMPANPAGFAFADFQLMYDPCTCYNNSVLKVYFTSILRSTVNLYGRLLATAQPISNIERGSGSLYGASATDNYLTSIYPTGPLADQRPLVGVQTYNRIQSLINDYQRVNPDPTKNAIIDGLNALLAGGAAAAGVYAGVGPGATLTSQQIYATTLGAVAPFTNFLGSQIRDQPNAEPQPFVIQGEMSMTGSIQSGVDLNGNDITFALPGAKNSNNAPEQYDADNHIFPYPVYNQILGPLGVLKTPNVRSYSNSWGRGGEMFLGSYSLARKYYKLENLDLVFNPEANIDLSKSSIKYAFVYLDDYNNPTTPQKIVTNFYDISTLGTYFSGADFLIWDDPTLGYAPSLRVVGIKVLVNLVSMNTNSRGNRNNSSFILTLPTNFYDDASNFQPQSVYFPSGVSYVTSGYASIDYSTQTMANFTFPSTQTYYPLTGLLRITGTLSSTSLARAVLSVDQAKIQPGGKIISGSNGVSVRTNSAVLSNPIPFYSGNIDGFCTSNEYRAAQPAFKNSVESDSFMTNHQPNKLVEPNCIVVISPNPVNSNAKVTFDIDRIGLINIKLLDQQGVMVRLIENKVTSELGTYDFTFDASGLTSGVYYLSVVTPSCKAVKKLSIFR
jgi:hypothetical protein